MCCFGGPELGLRGEAPAVATGLALESEEQPTLGAFPMPVDTGRGSWSGASLPPSCHLPQTFTCFRLHVVDQRESPRPVTGGIDACMGAVSSLGLCFSRNVNILRDFSFLNIFLFLSFFCGGHSAPGV